MTDKQIPIVCDLTVFSADTREKLAQEVPDLFRRVQAVHELPDGYAFQFPNGPGTFMALANFVEHERQCCPFFHFTLQVSPGGGPLQLSMTGGEEVKAYMEATWKDLQTRFAPSVKSDPVPNSIVSAPREAALNGLLDTRTQRVKEGRDKQRGENNGQRRKPQSPL